MDRRINDAEIAALNLLSDEDVDRLAIAIARALQQARSVSDSEHYDHHVWISGRILADKARKEFWEDMHQHLMKWGAVTVISGGGYALYLGVRQLLK